MRLAQALLASLVVSLGGCALPGPPFGAGSTVATVTQAWGAPTREHTTPAGGRRLEYAGGAYGKRTTMLDFDAAGRLVGSAQVRSEARFNAIRAGTSAADVLAEIGTPSTTWPIPRQNQIVWSYRYESPFCQWFMVGMSPQGQVIDTSYGPDPLCDDDNFFGRFRMRR